MKKSDYKKMPKESVVDSGRFAEFIKELRADKGLSQKGFAKYLGYCQRNVSAWELGLSGMPVKSFFDIVNACGFDVIIRRKER